jgi:hypothetical protein
VNELLELLDRPGLMVCRDHGPDGEAMEDVDELLAVRSAAIEDI